MTVKCAPGTLKSEVRLARLEGERMYPSTKCAPYRVSWGLKRDVQKLEAFHLFCRFTLAKQRPSSTKFSHGSIDGFF